MATQPMTSSSKLNLSCDKRAACDGIHKPGLLTAMSEWPIWRVIAAGLAPVVAPRYLAVLLVTF
jgi:hypothetical protein